MALAVIRRLKLNLDIQIDNLPDDIKKKIYYEYFDYNIKYERLMKLFRLQCKSHKRLIVHRHIRVTRLLNDTKLLEYIMERSSSFKLAYKYYVLNPSRYDFIKDDIEGFVLSWTLAECH
jgi:hypothetical protein